MSPQHRVTPNVLVGYSRKRPHNNKKPLMKKQIVGIIVAVAVTAWAQISAAAKSDGDEDQDDFPQIISQPTDTDVALGSSTVLTVQSTNADSFQWLRNGVAMDGQTNNSLKLEKVGVKDVGYYTCCVVKGYEVVPTRTATLTAFAATGGGTITVFGLPVVSGGSSSSCPGFTYSGYVNFIKTASQGWGWAPSAGTTLHTVTDTNRTDTKVYYLGQRADDGCALTTVAVPHPTVSAKYRFTVFFPNNVPTNTYAIKLIGFDP